MRSSSIFTSLALLSSLSVLYGCAESGSGAGKCSGSQCDLAVGGGGVDLSANDLKPLQDLTDPNAGGDFSEATDMTRLFVFGEPCSDPLQCADNICVLAGVSGFCSKQCADKTECPSGFDCFAVLGGGIDPGLVINICIPETNLLCTPCEDSTECSATGRDLCLPSVTGDKFCARDCATVSCPSNYDCKTVTVANKEFKQCIPKSGACDCNEDLKDTQFQCDIATPLGTTCKGARTCGGDALGWSMCNPPSMTDTLDDYVDNNCDGVDGVLTDAVFVSANDSIAADDDGCGLTPAHPCRHITFGMQVAWTYDRKNVYIQGGVYDETVQLISGFNLVGGFDGSWSRAGRTVSGHDVHITGTAWYDAIANRTEYVAIVGRDLSTDTGLYDLIIEAPDASNGAPGQSSYGVHLTNSNVKLTHVTIVGNKGANGSSGSDGQQAASLGVTSGMAGGDGGGANEHNTGLSCSFDEGNRGKRGPAGDNSCDSGGGFFSSTAGGVGGRGGSGDANGCNAGAGEKGEDGASAFGCPGGPGCGALPLNATCNSSTGQVGKDGTTTDGNGGSAIASGFLTAGYWRGKTGGGGFLGSHGGGGGGGSGSGGCDSGIDDWGAGGGGGGAGGCRARAAGTGGTGAGGSFGIVSIGSTVTVSDCKITRGIGGIGGKGGAGKSGQAGGSPGAGGPEQTSNAGDQAPGGNGGWGARGGHSGPGAGGAGGASYGVLNNNGTLNGSCSVAGGAPGQGGDPGDTVTGGKTAAKGSTGTSGDVLTCSSSTTCG